jgi:hypothetical protein
MATAMRLSMANGVAKGKPRAKRVRVVRVAGLRRVLTVGMVCGIPGLNLALSTTGAG